MEVVTHLLNGLWWSRTLAKTLEIKGVEGDSLLGELRAEECISPSIIMLTMNKEHIRLRLFWYIPIRHQLRTIPCLELLTYWKLLIPEVDHLLVSHLHPANVVLIELEVLHFSNFPFSYRFDGDATWLFFGVVLFLGLDLLIVVFGCLWLRVLFDLGHLVEDCFQLIWTDDSVISMESDSFESPGCLLLLRVRLLRLFSCSILRFLTLFFELFTFLLSLSHELFLEGLCFFKILNLLFLWNRPGVLISSKRTIIQNVLDWYLLKWSIWIQDW